MFQKKQLIYSETQGICRVENIVHLKSGKRQEVPYYVLRPLFEKEEVSYIPVWNHQVALRELFSREEAEQLKNSELIKENKKLCEAVEFVLRKGEEDAGKGTRL